MPAEWPDEKAIDEKALKAAVLAVREKLPPGAQFGPQLNALDAIEFCEIALTAAAKASRVIPVPKCETCGGTGRRGGYATDVSYCGDCGGTGVAEVIPVAVLRDFIAEERADALDAYHPENGMYDDAKLAEANALLDSLAALCDEHTRKEPTP